MKMKQYYVNVNNEGTISWYSDANRSIIHREDGPAIEYASGDKVWCGDGQYHRVDGPAVIESDGTKFWYFKGKLHRTDGPAVERANGTKYWYLNNEKLTEEEHRNVTQPVKELTVDEIEKLLGYKVKVVK